MIVRIYTGQDGQTHFEDLPQPTEEIHNVALQAGANLKRFNVARSTSLRAR